jgi:hypothetical protein
MPNRPSVLGTTFQNLTPASVNCRTPAGNVPPILLPNTILGVPMQDVILDPTKLLTAALSGQTIKTMVATVAGLQQAQPDPVGPPAPPPKTNTFNGCGGGIENIPFLQTNADAATLFATFWIEKIAGPTVDLDFLQLQYVQTVLLNFPVVNLGAAPGVNLSWPHVSVATLQKTFGGQ